MGSAHEFQHIEGSIARQCHPGCPPAASRSSKLMSAPSGFHLFRDRRAADAYLASTMVAGLTANAAFSGFAIRHFAVLEGLSRITRNPLIAAD